jgi:hypothetical protein
MKDVIAKYKIIVVVNNCNIENPKTIGILIKYGIAFNNGILYKIT